MNCWGIFWKQFNKIVVVAKAQKSQGFTWIETLTPFDHTQGAKYLF